MSKSLSLPHTGTVCVRESCESHFSQKSRSTIDATITVGCSGIFAAVCTYVQPWSCHEIETSRYQLRWFPDVENKYYTRLWKRYSSTQRWTPSVDVELGWKAPSLFQLPSVRTHTNWAWRLRIQTISITVNTWHVQNLPVNSPENLSVKLPWGCRGDSLYRLTWVRPRTFDTFAQISMTKELDTYYIWHEVNTHQRAKIAFKKSLSPSKSGCSLLFCWFLLLEVGIFRWLRIFVSSSMTFSLSLFMDSWALSLRQEHAKLLQCWH